MDTFLHILFILLMLTAICLLLINLFEHKKFNFPKIRIKPKSNIKSTEVKEEKQLLPNYVKSDKIFPAWLRGILTCIFMAVLVIVLNILGLLHPMIYFIEFSAVNQLITVGKLNSIFADFTSPERFFSDWYLHFIPYLLMIYYVFYDLKFYIKKHGQHKKKRHAIGYGVLISLYTGLFFSLFLVFFAFFYPHSIHHISDFVEIYSLAFLVGYLIGILSPFIILYWSLALLIGTIFSAVIVEYFYSWYS